MQAESVLKRKRGSSRFAPKKSGKGGVFSRSARRSSRRAGRLRRRNMATMGFLGIEKKFYDTSLSQQAFVAPVDATGAELDPSATSMISTPAQGDGEQNRDGKRINILSVIIDGHVRTAAAEAQVNPPQKTKVMVALVLDTQSNGAQMNSEDCFKNTSAGTDTAVTPVRNLLFGARFRVLKEAIFDVTPQSLTQQAANDYSWTGGGQTFKWFIKFPKGLVVNFKSGTDANIANVLDNSLHIIGFTNNTTAGPIISYNARIRFVG